MYVYISFNAKSCITGGRKGGDYEYFLVVGKFWDIQAAAQARPY